MVTKREENTVLNEKRKGPPNTHTHICATHTSTQTHKTHTRAALLNGSRAFVHGAVSVRRAGEKTAVKTGCECSVAETFLRPLPFALGWGTCVGDLSLVLSFVRPFFAAMRRGVVEESHRGVVSAP